MLRTNDCGRVLSVVKKVNELGLDMIWRQDAGNYNMIARHRIC